MPQVADLERVEKLEEQLEQFGRRLSFVERLIAGTKHLNRNQTLKALNVSSATLNRLRVAHVLVPIYEGSKPLYDVASVRAYLATKKIVDWNAEERILQACYEGA